MSAPEAHPVELIGRSVEASLLGEILDFDPGSPRSVLFQGDPGVGKTALLDLAAQMAEQRGGRVIHVRGTEYESDIAHSGLNQAVRALRPYGALLPAEQVDALRIVFGSEYHSEFPARLAVFSAFTALLSVSAEQRDLVVCLDDVQWLDRVSAEAYLFAARRLEGTRVSMIASVRTTPGWLADAPGIRVHRVPSLDPYSADSLLRKRFPALPPRVRERLLHDAEGNPLALLELPPALDERSLGNGPLPTNLPLTRRLQQTFAERIRTLSDAARHLLLMTALEGTGDLSVLRRALGEAGLRPLSEAEDAEIVKLSDTGDRLVFRHPLTWAAVAEEATAAQQREVHLKLADALESDLDRRARHLAAAVLEPDEDVAQVLHAAARRAAQVGPEGDNTAMTLLIRAADLSPAIEDQRKRMAEAAFVGAFRAATEMPAPALLDRVPDLEPGSDESLWSASATVFLRTGFGGDLRALFRLMDSTLDAAVARGNVESSAFATAVETYMYMCTLINEPEREDRFHAWSQAIPAEIRPKHLTVLSAMLDPARSAAVLVPVIDSAIEDALDSKDLRAVRNAATGAVYFDRLADCRTSLEAILESESQEEGQGDIPTRLLLSSEAFQSGRLDDALRIAEEGIAISELRRVPVFTAQFTYRAALVSAIRGDARAVRRAVDFISSSASDRGYNHLDYSALHALALDAAGRGDAATAFDAAARISRPSELARSVPLALRVFYELVTSAHSLGKISEARHHVEALRRLRISAISPHYALLVAACEAVLLDRSAKSAAVLAPHLAGLDVRRWPFDLARIRLLQAEFLIACNEPIRARAEATEARAVLDTLRAAPWIAAADRLLRELDTLESGVTPYGLTATELKVVRLAARGLTNKQIGAQLFLSDRTVGSHLYRSFPKLGITRRAALRDAVKQIDPQDPR